MNNDKYNGWTNRETWAVHLYITNDEGLYHLLSNQTAHDLKEFFEIEQENMIEGHDQTREMRMVLTDIGSLWRVNWREVEKALSDD